MKRHFQFLSFALSLVAVLFLTSCSKEELANPDGSISERGLTSFTTFSASLIGLTADNRLVHFNTARPTATRSVTITGLPAGERLLGIDVKPGTSTVYAVSSSSLLYQINASTGVASVISTRPFDPLLEGTMTGFDYNPTDATIRIVNDMGQNLRVSPLTGDVVGVDVALTPDSITIGAMAVSQGISGKNVSTMYDIDPVSGILYRQNFNSGMLSPIGNLGVRVLSEVGFDISAKGYGFAVFEGQGQQTGAGGPDSASGSVATAAYRVWQVNLDSGTVRPLAVVEPMIGLTAL